MNYLPLYYLEKIRLIVSKKLNNKGFYSEIGIINYILLISNLISQIFIKK